MNPFSFKTGFLLGFLLSIPVIVITYFADQAAGLPFVPFNLFDYMARVLPGAVVAFGIHLISGIVVRLAVDNISQAAKLAEQIIALLQFAVAGGIWGLILTPIGRKKTAILQLTGLITGLLVAIGFILINAYLKFPSAGSFLSSVWLIVVFTGWGWLLAKLQLGISAFPEAEPGPEKSRRGFLYLTGAAAVALLTGLSGLIYALQKKSRQPSSPPGELFRPEVTSGPAASPPGIILKNRIQVAPGTRPEITPTPEFYRIDINTRPPEIDAGDWRLTASGLVENPQEFSLVDVKAFPSVSQYITLSCISNDVGGSLISTALWTGFRLKDLMEAVGLLPETKQLFIRAEMVFMKAWI